MEAIGALPGIGKNSALRLALHLLSQPAENVHHFTQAVNELRDNVRYCSECNMICEEERCSVCADPRRNHSLICVVESIRDVLSIERSGDYRGVYHVLGGIISPINGIGPSDLNIAGLKTRLERLKAENPDCKPEIILALPGDVEGETTAFYLYRQIEPCGVAVSAIARGLGVSDGLQYADPLTLSRAISSRTPFKG